MRVLVCGSRDWTDDLLVNAILDGLWGIVRSTPSGNRSFTLIEGGAKGADTVAKVWAENLKDSGDPEKIGIPFEHLQFLADWKQHGRAAGPIRNKRMLTEGQPTLVLAFKNGLDSDLKRGGTENMIKQSKAAKLPVYHIQSLTTSTQLGMLDE